MKNPAAACAGLMLLVAVPAFAKDGVAEQFNAVVRVQPGGTLDVVETMVFRFEGASSREVVRELPRRGIDGIEVLELRIDDRRATDDEARVEGKGGNRIRWRIAHSSSSSSRSHTLRVRYRVHGAVRDGNGQDVLTWRMPGGEHEWRIESSTVDFELPAGVTATTNVDRHRTDTVNVAPHDGGARVTARGVREDGWIEVTIVMPAAAVLRAPPTWQRAERAQATYSTVWIALGLIVFAASLVPLFALRQGYDPPARGPSRPPALALAPDSAPPAVAGALARGGRASFEQAAGALFALADRGVIRVEEGHQGALGQKHYTLVRSPSVPALAPHEAALLETAFRGSEITVPLSKARGRIQRRLRRFSRAVSAELQAEGLFDTERRRLRLLFARIAGGFAVSAALGLTAWPVLMSTHGPWPLTIPAALACAAVAACVLYSTTTPLSNEGRRRADAWRAHRAHLKSVVKTKSDAPAGTLPYAVAFGLAGEWSKYLKHRPSPTPEWFRATADESDYAAFVSAAGAGAGDSGG